jgi:hypothetical protein
VTGLTLDVLRVLKKQASYFFNAVMKIIHAPASHFDKVLVPQRYKLNRYVEASAFIAMACHILAGCFAEF